MMTNAISKARSLAVSYEAFFAARRSNDGSGILLWGMMLIDAQNDLNMDAGNCLLLRESIERIMSETRAKNANDAA